MEVNDILKQRSTTHGDFTTGAAISQDLADCMRSKPGWNSLSDVQKEALEMAAHKIARILNGNPNFAEHWVDLAGYSTLAARHCPDYSREAEDA